MLVLSLAPIIVLSKSEIMACQTSPVEKWQRVGFILVEMIVLNCTVVLVQLFFSDWENSHGK